MNKKEIKTQSQEIISWRQYLILLLLDSLFIIIDNKDPNPTRLSRPEKKPDARRRVHRKLEIFLFSFYCSNCLQ